MRGGGDFLEFQDLLGQDIVIPEVKLWGEAVPPIASYTKKKTLHFLHTHYYNTSVALSAKKLGNCPQSLVTLNNPIIYYMNILFIQFM